MDKKSPHILNASSNLLGFCFVIITSLRISKINHSTYIDEFAGIASLFLAVSCFFSFLSIRTGNIHSENRYEKIADYLFISALICISISVVILSLDFIK